MTKDCVQKAYIVGASMAVGFAGSIKIGFELIKSFKEFLEPPHKEKGFAWQPDWVAENWSPKAKKIFDAAPAEEKKLHSEIIIVGASPKEDNGIPGWAKIYTIKLQSPNFVLKINENSNQILCIGNGANEYANKIQEILDDSSSSMKMEVAFSGGHGMTIMHRIQTAIKKIPNKHISEHLHYFIVKREGFIEGNNDYGYFENKEMKKFEMPKLATEYDELLTMLSSSKNAKSLSA